MSIPDFPISDSIRFYIASQIMPETTAMILAQAEADRAAALIPCPRCGEPCHPVYVDSYVDESWVPGHDCEPPIPSQ